jgi:predicted nucleic acid-binding protein
MKVLVDTSVWSLAFRRKDVKAENEAEKTLANLIIDDLVVMIGPVRQELLSGIANEAIYLNLQTKLAQFDDLPILTGDYETAAQFYNICRQHGIQGSHTDFLICAVAHNNNLLIFSVDQDFLHYALFLPIHLYRLL